MLHDLDDFLLITDEIDFAATFNDKGICMKQPIKRKLIERKREIDIYVKNPKEIRSRNCGVSSMRDRV